jgi:hypothetical protein
MTESTLVRTVTRDIGHDTFKIVADARTHFHPIALLMGPAAMVLSRTEALHIARGLIDAAQFLPKG